HPGVPKAVRALTSCRARSQTGADIHAHPLPPRESSGVGWTVGEKCSPSQRGTTGSAIERWPEGRRRAMSERVSMELLKRMLERLPGVPFCARMAPATTQSQWLYFDRRVADLYEASEAELESNPRIIRERYLPEDREQIDRIVAQSAK